MPNLAVDLTSSGGAASNVSNDSSVSGTTIKDALNTLKSSSDTNATNITSNTTSIGTKANRRLAINSQSGTTYTLVQGDEDTGVETTNASAVTVTAPQLAVGTQIPILQDGAGQITIAAGSGVTLRSPLGAKSLQQYTWLLVHWRSATEVIISGNTSS